MNLKVDQSLCIGCGACASICPECFEMNDQGKAEAIAPAGDDAQEAIESCPTGAISEEV